MRKLLVIGVGGIAAFGACCALAVWVLTEPAAPRSPGAAGAADVPAGAAGQAFGGASPPAFPAPPSTPPSPPQLPAQVRTWTPEDARFVPADPEHPYDPAAEAEKKKAIKEALQRGRRGRPPRSAEDLE